MAIFKKNKISEINELFADSIKKARQSKKINLHKAAQDLKINVKYLKAIETGSLNKLPEGLYKKNYLKEYALYLGLETDELDKITSTPGTSNKKSSDPFSRKVPPKKHFLLMPKIIKNIIIISVVFVCLGYLIFSINTIIKPPELTIIVPNKDLTTKEQIIKIQGFTEKEAKIIINEEEILTDKDGQFSKLINLKKGINTIIIVAEKKYGRKNIVERKIVVEN